MEDSRGVKGDHVYDERQKITVDYARLVLSYRVIGKGAWEEAEAWTRKWREPLPRGPRVQIVDRKGLAEAEAWMRAHNRDGAWEKAEAEMRQGQAKHAHDKYLEAIGCAAFACRYASEEEFERGHDFARSLHVGAVLLEGLQGGKCWGVDHLFPPGPGGDGQGEVPP